MPDAMTRPIGLDAQPSANGHRRLDERALRRPDFRDGLAVRLLDGQDWTFPVPFVYFDTSAEDDEAVVRRWSVGDRYGELLDALKSAQDAEAVARCEFALIKYLLRLNYDLKPADFAGLVSLSYAGRLPEDFRESMEAVRDAIYGRERPKSPSGDGDETP